MKPYGLVPGELLVGWLLACLLARFVRPKARFFFSGPTKDTIAPTIQRYESCAWLIQCLGVRVAARIAKGLCGPDDGSEFAVASIFRSRIKR